MAALPIQEAKLSIQQRSVALSRVFYEIEKQTGYSFLVRNNDINMNEKVSIDVKNKSVEEVLELLGFENRAEFIAYLDKLLGKPQIPEELWEEDVQKLLQNPAKLKNYPFEMTEEILKKYLNK